VKRSAKAQFLKSKFLFMKKETNESKLKKLIKENPTILNALLVERICTIMEMTMADIKENPTDWNKLIISPSLYEQLNENVKNILK
jgi:hypothetical protein